MNIRLVGPPAEVRTVVEQLRGLLDVLLVSKPYPTRRPGETRVYVEATPRGTSPEKP